MADMNFNPADVMFSAGPTGKPYLASEAIRATGKGPFDPAYRQNLATFAGGQFARPGGLMQFDPTDPNAAFQMFGTPTGAGSAPVMGFPATLLQLALMGLPFSWGQQPTPSTSQGGDGSSGGLFGGGGGSRDNIFRVSEL